MGLGDILAQLKQSLDAYSQEHRQHMTQQWEKSAKRAAAKEPAPLTDVQRMWRQMAEQEQQPAQLQQEVAAAPRPAAPQRTQVITSTPLVTVTWKIRLTSLGVIPMPWMEQQQS